MSFCFLSISISCQFFYVLFPFHQSINLSYSSILNCFCSLFKWYKFSTEVESLLHYRLNSCLVDVSLDPCCCLFLVGGRRTLFDLVPSPSHQNKICLSFCWLLLFAASFYDSLNTFLYCSFMALSLLTCHNITPPLVVAVFDNDNVPFRSSINQVPIFKLLARL